MDDGNHDYVQFEEKGNEENNGVFFPRVCKLVNDFFVHLRFN